MPLYIPSFSDAQMAALREAAAEQEREMKRCELCEDKFAVSPQWKQCGGDALVPLFDHTELLDARYLITLAARGGVLPRCQDVPHVAKITRKSAWRLKRWGDLSGLPILVKSYPWLDRWHPDRLGEQLKRLAPFLRLMLKQAPDRYCTVAVFIDYCSLPQHPRSSAEEARFRSALSNISVWYAHPFTHVLLSRGPLPTGGEYENKRTHGERGWCFFELQVASIVTDKDLLWDLSLFSHRQHTSYDHCTKFLRATRPSPLSPGDFAKELHDRVASKSLAFTNSADIESVVSQYEAGLRLSFDGYKRMTGEDRIFYDSQRWQADQYMQLGGVLAYAREHCSVLQGDPLTVFVHKTSSYTPALRSELSKLAGAAFIVRIQDDSRFSGVESGNPRVKASPNRVTIARNARDMRLLDVEVMGVDQPDEEKQMLPGCPCQPGCPCHFPRSGCPCRVPAIPLLPSQETCLAIIEITTSCAVGAGNVVAYAIVFSVALAFCAAGAAIVLAVVVVFFPCLLVGFWLEEKVAYEEAFGEIGEMDDEQAKINSQVCASLPLPTFPATPSFRPLPRSSSHLSWSAHRNRAEQARKDINNAMAADSKVIKMLLLGAGEAGKSTIFKQMKIINKDGYSHAERKAFIGIVHSNTIILMNNLLEAFDKIEVDLPADVDVRRPLPLVEIYTVS